MELQEHCFTVLYFELQANNGCLKKKKKVDSNIGLLCSMFFLRLL